MQASDDQEFKQLQRHSKFYLNGGDLHLLLDKLHFRVHRYFFERESQKFRDVILAPGAPEHPRKGDSDSTAIILHVPVEDFEMLLGVFYNPRYSVYDWTVNDWTRILTLAHEWEFNEVKNLAIRELEKQKITLVYRIALYQRFMVDYTSLIPHYVKLCSRDEPPDEAESIVLGMKTTVLIFRARERLRAKPSDGGKSPLPTGLEEGDVLNTILEMIKAGTPVSSPLETDSDSSDSEQGGRKGGPSTGNHANNSSRGVKKNSNGRTGREVGCQRPWTGKR